MSGIDIDSLYEGFCEGLPAAAKQDARALAFTLRLIPSVGIPWSAVFKNTVTLQAPWLCADAMSGVPTHSVERAVLAHMLAVIEAFGTDRIADRQVEGTPGLRRVLELMREARDAALQSLGGTDSVRMARGADERTGTAIATERELLLRGAPVSLQEYESVSAGKQAVGLPAAVALADAAGWSSAKSDALRATLMGVWLGLQFQDDVVDWEDDATRGGAWAVLLAQRSSDVRGDEGRDALRRFVLSSGVLPDMLRLAQEQYQVALSGAEAMGSERLSSWLRERAAEARDYWEKEREHPGYVSRLKKLAPWSAEVFR